MLSIADTRGADTRRAVTFVVLALSIVAANVVIVSSYPAWEGRAAPEWPVAVDLLLVVPLLYLALNYRQGWAAVWRAAAIAGVGVLLGSYLIPQESKQLWLVLEPLRYVVLGALLLAQVCVVAWVIGGIFAARHKENLEVALDRTMNRWLGHTAVSALIRLEARMWLYALLRMPIRQPFPGERHFHVGKQGMNASNQLGFLILIGAEIPVAHFLIWLFDPLVAAVVSALAIYGFLFMLAEYRATAQRPISADSRGLQIRYGIVTDCFVPWQAIAHADRFSGAVPRAKGVRTLVGMGQANVVLELAPGTRLSGLFGQRDTTSIYLGVDDPAALLAEVQSRTGHHGG